MKYAIITDGIVTNIIFLNPKNADDFPGAVQSDIAAIGDEYQDGRFYRDGEIVKTMDEMYAQVAAENADMRQALSLLGVEAEEVEDDA